MSPWIIWTIKDKLLLEKVCHDGMLVFAYSFRSQFCLHCFLFQKFICYVSDVKYLNVSEMAFHQLIVSEMSREDICFATCF